MSSVKNYISKEMKILKDFCELLQKPEIQSKLSDKINKAIKQYLTVINGINYIKFSYVVYKNTDNIKEQILRHQDNLFIQPRPIIPSLDLTEIHYVIKDTDYIGIFWDLLAQLAVLSAIITKEIEKNNEKLKKEKENEDLEKKMKEFKLESGNVSLSSMVDNINDEYENSALLDFVNEIDTENSNITDVLMNVVKKIDLGAEIDKLDENNMKEINNVVQGFFGDKNTDFSFLVKDIAQSLKTTDITKGNITENIQNVAENLTEKMMKSRNQTDLKNMAMNAQGIMKDYDPNKDMMANVETIMKSKFGRDGINKNMINEAMQTMGLNGILGSVGGRKMKRMAEREMKKSTPAVQGRNAHVNAKQAQLKAKYLANKKKAEEKEKEKEKQSQNQPKQSSQSKQTSQNQTQQKSQSKQTQQKQQPKKK